MSTKMTIIATKGTLDWAYPPFILGSTAAALDFDVTIFFTFYGLTLLKKEITAQVSPLGNPAMPMKMPIGPKWFRNITWNIPNFVQSLVPGYEALATTLMKKTISNVGVASVTELRSLCMEAGVKMMACQMTVDLFGFDKSEFIDGIEFVGASSYLDIASEAQINLFT
ncbi:MAG: peroxiredoxin family protein [Nitrospirae bacterium CG18_big_fil_WC_8_21_14_2_50_70_55]|nr:peroxiredoxin family protein [Deltaproteobacteria bacterium]OIP65588.1 MAG: NADH dehydrogenase [Nitrospirae bacterium CG2_30_70_394]PIQ04775.1 MAG: peroxiredoxin family protein [Nitrospirae bacterium CG18_big_fil_WC_8_21_14_2_50_70_55]PIU78215.1 MAG: peroxiredoxin family protein [Nitrospirae bacterium CG06_land_8_20_14_3_00_70_43]PIW82220.1 MAG: peroxiredoxin family protein [Nitrospirae bacterium CG_4_8_14_3_um_filter_70_85]PIX83250.1 MAG: peroxiredoxin family protein [Nitrospirae bacterium